MVAVATGMFKPLKVFFPAMLYEGLSDALFFDACQMKNTGGMGLKPLDHGAKQL
jgi:hypothetical protein